MKACCIENDCIRTKLPIHFALFEMLLFELNRKLGSSQVYLCTMYKALFSLAYYGLMRIGELAESKHAVKAANILVGNNKNKILIILYSSKMHRKESAPQQIKISATESTGKKCRNFCPFTLINDYIKMRGPFLDAHEPFFVLRDKSPLQILMVRTMLRSLITNLRLQEHLYSFHCFRSGRASDLLKFGFTVEQIKCMGHWKSNAVCRYLKD